MMLRFVVISHFFGYLHAQLYYIETGPPVVAYYSPEYVSDLQMSGEMLKERKGFYKFSIQLNLLKTVGDNLRVDIDIHEKRGVTEKRVFNFHLDGCKGIMNHPLIHFFARILESLKLKCPFEKGTYSFKDLKFPLPVPSGLPIPNHKVRMYTNITIMPAKEVVFKLYFDTNLKKY